MAVRKGVRATLGIVFVLPNREDTFMFQRTLRKGFDSEGIYLANAEGMRAGCGRNDRGSSYEIFFIRRRLLTNIGRNPVEPILSSGWPLKSSQSEPMVICRVCRQLRNTGLLIRWRLHHEVERQAQPPRTGVRATDCDLLEEVLPSF